MSTVNIRFSDLHDAASRARNAAGEMNGYADRIPSSVSNPLSNLAGGSSNYISNAIALANKKRSELQRRSSAYMQLASALDRFADNARQIDEQVGRRIAAVADKRAEGLPWWEKAGYYIFKSFNHSFGSTEAGAMVGNVLGWGDVLVKKRDEALKGIRDWFAHGDGKYYLNIALAGIGIVAGIIGTILTFPVSGALAITFAVLGVVATVVAAVDGLAKIKANVKALQTDSSEPGQARYQGDISDLSAYAKRNSTDSRLQAAAKIFDMVGKAAGVASFLGNLGMVRSADGVKRFAFNKETLKANIGSKFGFKYDRMEKSWSFDLKPLNLSSGDHFLSGHPNATFAKAYPAFVRMQYGLETVSNVLNPIESTLKIVQTEVSRDGKFDGFSDVKSFTKGLESMFGGLSGFDGILGSMEDVCDIYQTATGK